LVTFNTNDVPLKNPYLEAKTTKMGQC